MTDYENLFPITGNLCRGAEDTDMEENVANMQQNLFTCMVALFIP